jgi:hypothetical protein
MSQFGDIDARQLTYAIFGAYTLPSAGVFRTIFGDGWMVMRVQAWNAADTGASASLQMAGGLIGIAPGGCIDLRPEGLYRRGITVQVGSGATNLLGFQVVVEYAWKTLPSGITLPVFAT